MVAVTASAQQHTLTNIPKVLWNKPVVGLSGWVTNRIGTNLIIANKEFVEVRGAGSTQYFRGPDGKMQYRTTAGSVSRVPTIKLYKLLGYPNWQEAQIGDRVSMRDVSKDAIKKARPVLN
jgi:hypothetical protein